MFLTKKSVLSVLTICAILHFGRADDCPEASGGAKSLSLCQEFQAIRDLAPNPSVIAIIQNHCQNDRRFRMAVQYMQSTQFLTTTQQIDATSVYQNIMQQFTAAGVNTTDINAIAKIFNCIIIPMIQQAPCSSGRSVDAPITQSRSLNTVLVEVNNLIPRDAFMNTLTTHLANNTQFASFYKVMRTTSFQTLALQGFRSSQVARYIKTLRHHQIDLCQMIQYAFNLFASGPTPK